MTLYVLGGDEPQVAPDANADPKEAVIGRVRLGSTETVWCGAVLRRAQGGSMSAHEPPLRTA
ncbi:hypothetical protein BN1232_05669 [Mycobacterium lentiflavum]|uniref:Uncharacterized protein n=1 Tax=Mycobacterium lentiflavum TaxID=141349 RepID=A0A0E4H2I3_MYCLN|nr:hypothetical protein BN1232_05669 [Mycobacterium lentiflavum]